MAIFDIPVNITVEAVSEEAAEAIVHEFEKDALQFFPEIVAVEPFEFVADLKRSCCC